MVRVAIVGLGKGGSGLLKILLEEKIEVIVVCDLLEDNPGVTLAKKHNIPYINDYRKIANFLVDVVFDLTHDPKITEDLLNLGQGRWTTIGGLAANLIWNMAYERDVREKALREEHRKLLETKEYLNSILEHSPDMIITTDLDNKIVTFNRGGEIMLGYSRDETIGMSVRDLWTMPEERNQLLEVIRDKGYMPNFEAELKKKDGQKITVSLTLSRLNDPEGNMMGTVGISKDITEQKMCHKELKEKTLQLEEMTKNLEQKVRERTKELEEAMERLKELNLMKSQFLARVSHELRTPLNSIIGFSELLLEKDFGALNERQERYLNNVLRSGNHLLTLINDILDLSKIETGRMELHLELFHLKELMESTEEMVKPMVDEKSLDIQMSLAENLGMMYADRARIRQILYNLLSNAIKFTPKGGSITVKAKRNTGEFVISVTDTGIGIAEEDQERIFQEFEQVGNAISREYGGTGLGLTLVRRLSEMHQGKVFVKSKPEQGSTFTVTIPVQEEKIKELPVIEVEKARIEKEIAPSELFQPLVLIAEDDLYTQEILTLELIKQGYLVAHAYDGEEAIRKAREENPFVIILDIMLTKKDGWEVMQILKKEEVTRDIPIIIYSVLESRELGFALGAIDYFTKPIDKNKLIKRLDELSFSARARRKPLTILAVDDDPNALELIASILEPKGFGVLRACSGEEGLKLALELSPDIIILDLMMPRVDGFQVIEKLRRHPLGKDIPIIVMTAKELTREEREYLRSKVQDVMEEAKLSPVKLLDEIKKIELLYPKRADLVDSLTGLFNRKYLDLCMKRELNRAERYGRTFSLLYIDIDNFKEYNRKVGSVEGDYALKKIAGLMQSNLRTSDVVIRYSGEEIVVILPETVRDSSKIVAEKLRNVISSYPFRGESPEQREKITLSIGICDYASDGKDRETLLRIAERRMRKSKETGGNRVITDG